MFRATRGSILIEAIIACALSAGAALIVAQAFVSFMEILSFRRSYTLTACQMVQAMELMGDDLWCAPRDFLRWKERDSQKIAWQGDDGSYSWYIREDTDHTQRLIRSSPHNSRPVTVCDGLTRVSFFVDQKGSDIVGVCITASVGERTITRRCMCAQGLRCSLS